MMGEGQRAWLLILLSALATLSTSLLTHLMFPAEIVSDNGNASMIFAVGSDVIIQCRVFNATLHNVTKMRLHSRTTNEDLHVITVGDDVIQTTLRNVIQIPDEVIECLEGSNFLYAQTICVGYAPSQDLSLDCRLYPRDRLECCAHTDQPQDILCDITWFMEYRETREKGINSSWRPFPGSEEGRFEVSQCVSWPYEDPGRSNYANITVRVTANSSIGSAWAVLDFKPIHHVVPGAAEDLTVRSIDSDPSSLLVSWHHSSRLGQYDCKSMGGLSYRLTLNSSVDRQPWTVVHQSDCYRANYREGKEEELVSGLVPYTTYDVTVTPLSPLFSGPPAHARHKTSQSKPLRALSVVGWSASASTSAVVVYWKTLGHRHRGGPIVAYNVTVTSMTRTSRDYHFTVSQDLVAAERQLVTSPHVLAGCVKQCVVNVTSSTVAGWSAPTSVNISSRLRDLKTPIVYTEKMEDGSRMVSWKGSVNVTSVVWCYGKPFPSDSTLVRCQTDLGQKAVDRPQVQHMVIPKRLLRLPQDRPYRSGSRQMCENCRWHFAVRVTDTPFRDSNISQQDTAAVTDYYGNDTDTVPGWDEDVDPDNTKETGFDDVSSDFDDVSSDFDDVTADFNDTTAYGYGSDFHGGFELIDPINDDGRKDSESMGAESFAEETKEDASSISDKNYASVVLDSEDGKNDVGAKSSGYIADSVGSETGLDDAEDGTRRLVWNQCQYTVDGNLPLPEVKVAEAVTGESVTLTIQSTCSKSLDHRRPQMAQVTYRTPPRTSCSVDAQTTNVSLPIHNDGTSSRDVHLAQLSRGHYYTVCVRLGSAQTWGAWHAEQFYYSTLADDKDLLLVILVSGLAAFLLVLLACSIRSFRRSLRRKSERFSKMDFTIKDERGNNNPPVHLTDSETPLSSTTSFTRVVPPEGGSLSSKDSAFEGNSDKRESDPVPETRLLTGKVREADVHERYPLLGVPGDYTVEVEMRQLPGVKGETAKANIPELGEILRALSVQNNVQTNPKSAESADCFSPEEHIWRSLLGNHTCHEGKQHIWKDEAKQREPIRGEDTGRVLCPDSVEPPSPTADWKEAFESHTGPEFQYVTVDSALHPCEPIPRRNSKDSQTPCVLKGHGRCSWADDQTAACTEQLGVLHGTCGVVCFCQQPAFPGDGNPTFGFPHSDCLTRHPTDLSDSLNSSTDETTPPGDSYIPLEHAVGALPGDNVSAVPAELDLKTPVSYVSVELAVQERSAGPDKRNTSQCSL